MSETIPVVFESTRQTGGGLLSLSRDVFSSVHGSGERETLFPAGAHEWANITVARPTRTSLVGAASTSAPVGTTTEGPGRVEDGTDSAGVPSVMTGPSGRRKSLPASCVSLD